MSQSQFMRRATAQRNGWINDPDRKWKGTQKLRL